MSDPENEASQEHNENTGPQEEDDPEATMLENGEYNSDPEASGNADSSMKKASVAAIPHFKNKLEPLKANQIKPIQKGSFRKVGKKNKKNSKFAKRNNEKLDSSVTPKLSKQHSNAYQMNCVKQQSLNDNSNNSITITPRLSFEVIWRNLTYYRPSGHMFGSKKSKSSSKADAKSTCKATKAQQPILNNISGSFRSGQMTAIMGPSGAGKTVFLNCVCGFLQVDNRKENCGDIIINGAKSVQIGFVGQFDHLLPHLTVRETLLFASRIKNVARFYLNHEKIVDSVMKRLDIFHVRDIYAMNCSNGQRKRLSIAIELVFNSDILMLDEPTSGLDSVTGFQIMDTLKSLTKRSQSIAIIATIHQPSRKIFHLFDNLVILSKKGSIIYQGSCDDLPQTLQLVGLSCPPYSNMSDYILEVASGDMGKQCVQLLKHYNKESCRNKIPEDVNEFELTSLQEAIKRGDRVNHRSVLLCTWQLFWRVVLCNFRNPFNTKIRAVTMTLNGVFLGLIFTDVVGSISTCPPSKYYLWQMKITNVLEEVQSQEYYTRENVSLLFMILLVSLFNSLLNLVVTFSEEAYVFHREYNNYSYTILSFFVAKILGDLPFIMISTVMFTTIVHRMTGQFLDHWNRLWLLLLPCCQVTFLGEILGLLIGVLFYRDILAAIYGVLIVIIPIVLFSGFFKMLTDMSELIRFLSYTSLLRPAMNALLIVVYGLDRCQWEYQNLKNKFASMNQSGELKRPEWIDSLSSMIDLQISISSVNSSLHALQNTSLEKEDKLIKYMGYSGSNTNDASTDVTAMVLQHFDLQPTYESYWAQINELTLYIIILSISLYLLMMFKLRRSKN